MVYAFGIPAKSERVVALNAICGESSRNVVRILGSEVVVTMAFNTFVANWVEHQGGFVGMAFHTTQVGVYPDKGKSILLVYFWNIKDEPTIGRVAPHTIIAYRLVMDIGMAGNAIGWRIFEDQITMARGTINLPVRTFQIEICGIVVE
ncbi:MAG: hypothetical protein CMC08_05920 [Flavobacteriaceae bacterium]|nr:hypothetical protein [Flavobacteriaceae bacterium]